MDRLTPEMTDALETPRPRCIWLTLEGPDIIEMKQVVLDRDAPGMEVTVKAELPSRWLQEFVRKRGGVLNFARRMVCLG